MRLVLASRSPRRARLLAVLGLSFEQRAVDVAEDWLDGESPGEHAERLSREKALAAVSPDADEIVVAGDTIVVLGGKILGKPGDGEEAVELLTSLAGRTHEVISAVAAVGPDGALVSALRRTRVTFRSFPEKTARRYVETGEPMDKAGAYGIQGYGAVLVERIEGDYYTVVGLPLVCLLELLESLGWRYDFGSLVPIRAGVGDGRAVP